MLWLQLPLIIYLTTPEYSSEVDQNLVVIMLNTMVIVKMGNCTYDEQKKAFDADSDTDAQFMKYIIVGKVDEHTALLNADVFAPKKWKQ